jgi:tRNA (guanine26-N2/guanine27-N2)-dimethyltransferase
MSKTGKYPRKITEGGIIILLPEVKSADTIPRKSETVFYNPKQLFNRDISVLVLKAIFALDKRPLNVCDLFSASGIRGLRYLKELPLIETLVLNDINPDAVKLINNNIVANKILIPSTTTIKVTQEDASKCLLLSDIRFDVIDVDPFGSPARFLYPAFQNLNRNGILCLTATDMTVLTGVYPHKTFKSYGTTHISKSLSFCHDIAVRVLISAAQRIALQQGFGLIPIFSFSVDHYIRLFLQRVRNKTSTVQGQGFIAYCPNCDHREQLTIGSLPDDCNGCGHKMNLLGPLWLGQIAREDVVNQCLIEFERMKADLGTSNRVERFLKLLREEIRINTPWFYSLHHLCKNRGHLSAPPTRRFILYIQQKGFEGAATHYSPVGIKTPLDAKQLREEITNYYNDSKNKLFTSER